MIDADPVATTVRVLMVARTEWTGTASDLLGALEEIVEERIAKSKTWPDSPRALSGRLRRAATFLRKIGIEIGFDREGRARTRTIRITASTQPAAEDEGARPSASSASSAPPPKHGPANDFAEPNWRTQTGEADGSGDGSASTVRDNPPKSNGTGGADGEDANHRPQSGPQKAVWSARL